MASSELRRDFTPPADLVVRLMREQDCSQDEAVARATEIVRAADGTLAPRGQAMTANELHRAEVRYRRASTAAERERDARNRAVRAAIAAGWTHAQIAQATGLTRGRVGQIATSANRPSIN